MPWKAFFNEVENFVEVTYYDHVGAADLEAANFRAVSLGLENKCREFLVDAVEVKFDGSLFDIFELPERVYKANNVDRRSCISLILPRDPKSIESARFYQTVCRNRGWMVSTFPDRSSAVAWLKSR